jgi:hypothetical protein
VGGHRLTDEVRVRAAWLWAGDEAAVSGPAAAYRHGLLDRAPTEIELTVPHRRKPRTQRGLVVRRRDLHHVDVVGNRDIRLTALPLTVLETAVALPGGSAFLDLVRILREAGITGWVLGHPFGPWRIDLAFPARRVAVEVDGWAWHVDAQRFANDRRKQNALVRAGWDPLRFTWHDLDGRPRGVAGEIRATLAAAA